MVHKVSYLYYCHFKPAYLKFINVLATFPKFSVSLPPPPPQYTNGKKRIALYSEPFLFEVMRYNNPFRHLAAYKVVLYIIH
jgi:hypothetical protein